MWAHIFGYRCGVFGGVFVNVMQCECFVCHVCVSCNPNRTKNMSFNANTANANVLDMVSVRRVN